VPYAVQTVFIERQNQTVETSCEEKHVLFVDSMKRGFAFVWGMNDSNGLIKRNGWMKKKRR